MEEWLEVSVKVTHEAVEAVAELLRETGARNGVLIEDPVLLEELREHTEWELCPPKPSDEDLQVVTVSAFYPEDKELQPRLARIDRGLALIEERIGAFRFGPVLFRKVSEKDWANEWKQYFHVTHVGKHIVIKPSWEQYDAQTGDVVLELDPGMAFGTGTHPTTCLCLQGLEEIIRPDTQVFDVGTGSGILAMAAAPMGARDIKAVDIDGVAGRPAPGKHRQGRPGRPHFRATGRFASRHGREGRCHRRQHPGGHHHPAAARRTGQAEGRRRLFSQRRHRHLPGRRDARRRSRGPDGHEGGPDPGLGRYPDAQIITVSGTAM